MPAEIRFIWDDNIKYIGFTIEKCNPIGQDNGDPACSDGSLPVRLDWTLRMKVSLVQPAMEYFGVIDFPARILDPCLTDAVSMLPVSVKPIDYTLLFTPQRAVYECQVVQTYPLCPLSCSVTKAGTSMVPIFIDTYTQQPVTLTQPHPSVKSQAFVMEIVTGLKDLDMTKTSLDIVCESTYSQIPERQALD